MKTEKKMVKSVFMSIMTAVLFTFAFTACSDDLEGNGADGSPASASAGSSALEAYGLTFETFDNENDVQILNADTTEISVSKAYADKLGITSFVNHPMGIWHKMSQLPYIRKAKAEKLVGDRYILTVEPATVAEIIGDKKVNLQTDIYVNSDAESIQTRAAGCNIPGYAAKYIDTNNVIHPAVVHLTDPYGYKEDYHTGDEQPEATETRAAQSGEYKYMTAEELLGETRWSISKRLLGVDTEVKRNFKFAAKDSKDSVQVNFKAGVNFELNYFLTLEGGLKWSGILPEPYVEKFETGVDGSFGLDASVEFAFEKKLDLGDKLKFELAKFNGYSFTFWVGPVPILISIDPNIFMKFDGSISGKVSTGFKYEYGNEFMGGARYTDGRGWEGMGYFRETANKFSIIPPRVAFKYTCGMGIFLGADITIYKCAGPELAIGPHLGGELNATFKPIEAQTAEDLVDLNGKIMLNIDAELGAKLTLLGYKLAEATVTIPLAGPWTLMKFPSDGTEHKVGDTNGVASLPPSATPWPNFYQKMERGICGKAYKEDMKKVMSMLKEMYNYDDATAHQMIIDRIQSGWDHEPNGNYAEMLEVLGALGSYMEELEVLYYDYQYQKAGETGDYQWINAENWKKIGQKMSSRFTWYCYGTTPDQGLENIRKWFKMAFKREPDISSAEDMAWIAERYRNYPEWEYKYQRQIPTP
ncbi:MAG: hypothetical protein J6T43_06465 [Prevotella sp.]|nr:hypothetical protein [Prevotella sp.]